MKTIAKILLLMMLLLSVATPLRSFGKMSCGTPLPTDATPDEKAVLKDIEQQASARFSEKFKLITSSLTELSRINLDRFNSLVALRETEPYRHMALALAKKLDSELWIQHSTYVNRALDILKSGYLYSMDELVRQKQIEAPLKACRFTNYNYDGAIGEQDVVYLALQKRSFTTDGFFGPVTFVFNRQKVFERSYFSLFPFSMGSNISLPQKAKDAGSSFLPLSKSMPYVSKMIPLYRDFLFQGEKTYQEVLRLSALEYLWHSSQFSPNLFKAAKDYLASVDKEFLSSPSASLPEADLNDESSWILDSISRKLKYPQKLSPTTFRERISALRFLSGLNDPTSTDTDLIFSAYQGLPLMESGRAPIFTSSFGFWEIKVPEKLSLDYVDLIILPVAEPPFGSQLDYLAKEDKARALADVEQTNALQTSVETYAALHKRKYLKTKSRAHGKSMVIYTFANS